MSEYEFKTVNGKKKPVHVLIAESLLGRKLAPDEVVHHINGNKKDNRPENLQVMQRGEHSKLHALERSENGPSPETLKKQSEAQKGRINAARKLSEDEVMEIVGLLWEGHSLAGIGRVFHVQSGTIAAIRDGKAYRDVLEKIPDLRIPICPPYYAGSKRESLRKLTLADVTLIRIGLLSGRSIQSIAKDAGVSPATIRRIRDRQAYNDIPWPVEIGRYYSTTDIPSILNWILSRPMTEQEDDLKALKEDYKLLPNLQSIAVLRMIRKALAGDAWLGYYLLSMSCYSAALDNLMFENSQLAACLYGERSQSGECVEEKNNSSGSDP